MERIQAVLLGIFFFLIFFLFLYFGARIRIFSSLVFSIFLSLILLNLFYPPSNLAYDYVDYSLFIYAGFQIIAIAIIFVYLTFSTLNDKQEKF